MAFTVFSCKKKESNSVKTSPITEAHSIAEAQGEQETSPAREFTQEEQEARAAANSKFETEAEALHTSGEWEAKRFDFYERWGRADGVAAITHALAKDQSGGTAYVATALKSWGSVDPKNAMNWLSAQKAGPDRSIWFSSLIEGLPLESLAETQAYLAQWLDTPGGAVAARSYAKRMVKEEPGIVYDWLATGLDGSPRRGELLQRITRDWAIEDPEAASGWLSQADAEAFWLPDAIEGLALAIVDQNPEEAQTWINSIQDEKRREEALARLNSPR